MEIPTVTVAMNLETFMFVLLRVDESMSGISAAPNDSKPRRARAPQAVDADPPERRTAARRESAGTVLYFGATRSRSNAAAAAGDPMAGPWAQVLERLNLSGTQTGVKASGTSE